MLFLSINIFICLCGISYINGKHDERDRSSADKQCPSKYKMLGEIYQSTHSACQKRDPSVTKSGVSTEDAIRIVELHNKYRESVNPPAANMLKVDWDEEVAMIAQAWANTCSYDHDENYNRKIPGRFAVGQNIGKGFKSWKNVIKGWYNEHTNFSYGQKNNNFHETGHYTQLVWAISSKVGCGFAQCGETNYHVCNYAPGGNSPYEKFMFPYKNATSSCEDCRNTCSGKLCDCGNLYCENGGYLNLTTCMCTCQEDFYEQEYCRLQCDGNVMDNSLCGNRPWNKDGCRNLDNVGFHCPNLCSLCDINTVNTEVPDTNATDTIINNYINGTSKAGSKPTSVKHAILLFIIYCACKNKIIN